MPKARDPGGSPEVVILRPAHLDKRRRKRSGGSGKEEERLRHISLVGYRHLHAHNHKYIYIGTHSDACMCEQRVTYVCACVYLSHPLLYFQAQNHIHIHNHICEDAYTIHTHTHLSNVHMDTYLLIDHTHAHTVIYMPRYRLTHI